MQTKALLLALESSRVCPAELKDLGKAGGGGEGVVFLKFRLTSAGQHPLQRVCKPLVGGLIDDCSLLDINTHTHTQDWEGSSLRFTGRVWTNTDEKLLHYKLLTHPSDFFYCPCKRKHFLLPYVNRERLELCEVHWRRKKANTLHCYKKKVGGGHLFCNNARFLAAEISQLQKWRLDKGKKINRGKRPSYVR